VEIDRSWGVSGKVIKIQKKKKNLGTREAVYRPVLEVYPSKILNG